MPTDQCVTLYDALCERRRRRSACATPATTRSTRCASRPGRRAWGAELSPDETPWEAGLGYAVKLDKPAAFIGRDALLRAARAAGVRKRLVQFTFDDPAAFPWGGEPILMDGRNVGELTSAGYSRKLGRAVAMGYARAADAPPLTDDAILARALRGRHRRRRCSR